MTQASPRACREQFPHLPPWEVKAFVSLSPDHAVAMRAPGTAHAAELIPDVHSTSLMCTAPWAGHPTLHNTCRQQPGLPREAALTPLQEEEGPGQCLGLRLELGWLTALPGGESHVLGMSSSNRHPTATADMENTPAADHNSRKVWAGETFKDHPVPTLCRDTWTRLLLPRAEGAGGLSLAKRRLRGDLLTPQFVLRKGGQTLKGLPRAVTIPGGFKSLWVWHLGQWWPWKCWGTGGHGDP